MHGSDAVGMTSIRNPAYIHLEVACMTCTVKLQQYNARQACMKNISSDLESLPVVLICKDKEALCV